MRLIQISWIFCLLFILASPATVYAAQPSGQVYGPVSAKETLSEIAQRVRGEWRIPLKYVVQAMYELNPQAFSESGIGSLQLGSMLAIPDMKALIEEVPELLPHKPKPPKSKPASAQTSSSKPTATRVPQAPVIPRPARQTAKPDPQQKEQLQVLIQKQLGQIESLARHDKQNVNTIKKLTDQVNISQLRIKTLQEQLNNFRKQRRSNDQRLLELEEQLKSPPSTSTDSISNKIQLPYFGPVDLYLVLLTIPAVLSLIALFVARRPPEPVEITISEPSPAPALHPQGSTSEPEQPPQHKPATDAITTRPPNNKAETDNKALPADSFPEEADEALATSNIAEEKADEPPATDNIVEEVPDEELYEKGESTAPLDEEEPASTENTEAAAQVDEPEEFMTPEEADELEKTGDVATVDLDDLDDIQQLKTTEDEIEAKLSFAYLHLDMGDADQAEKTLAEIDLNTYPQFTEKVNEIRQLMVKPSGISDLTQPQTAEQAESPDTQPEKIQELQLEPEASDESTITDLQPLTQEQEAAESPDVQPEKTQELELEPEARDESTIPDLQPLTQVQQTAEFELDIEQPTEAPGEQKTPEAPVEIQATTSDDASSSTQETTAPKLTALEKVLIQQLKLAATYNKQGKLEQSKSYVAKILRNGTPDYRKRALILLQDIESKELAALTARAEQQLIESDKTVVMQPNGTPAKPKVQSGDILLATGIHEIVPKNLSDRFTAYTENEEGTKLTLAYLFLDLDEVDTATQLLEEVLESGDPELVKEAEEILEQLVVF